MPRPPLSVTIIALNEEQSLPRAIRSVSWADEIVVVDSGSTDRTLEVARSLGAKVFQNAWQGYGQQKNYAQRQASHDWILNLDADECVSAELAKEIQDVLAATSGEGSAARGFQIPRRTYYLGQWIRHGGWYPNYLTRLANRNHARWSEPQVHEMLEVDGPVARLKNPLDHFSFNSIHEQILTNATFSKLGGQDLARRGKRPSVLKLLLKPPGKFLETYFLKRGFLDGLAGFIISVNAAHSIFLKYAYLLENRIQHHADTHHRQ